MTSNDFKNRSKGEMKKKKLGEKLLNITAMKNFKSLRSKMKKEGKLLRRLEFSIRS